MKLSLAFVSTINKRKGYFSTLKPNTPNYQSLKEYILLISWIGLWVLAFSVAGLVATVADIDNLHKNKTVIIFFFFLSVASGLAVVFR